MSVKLCHDRLQEVGDNFLVDLAKHTAVFLNGTPHSGDVFSEDILAEERNLMFALNFSVSAPTVLDWIEFLFRRNEVITGRGATPLHRFAADLATRFCESLLFQVNLCAKICPSEVAVNMWYYALMITYRVALVGSRLRCIYHLD